MSEFKLIDKITRKISSDELTGVGDDCAVIKLASNRYQVISVDTLIEGVHFKRNFSSWSEIGYKSLAVSLSDISAMGANPQYFLASLQINSSISSKEVKELYRGMYDLADTVGVVLLGGDTVYSKTIGISITVIGESNSQPILRSGAKVGDLVFVTGIIGEASCGLSLLNKKMQPNILDNPDACLKRHKSPSIDFELATLLKPSAMIDISDGLFQDASHIADRSNIDLKIEVKKIPTPFKQDVPKDMLYQHLSGGDDYQLIFCSSDNSSFEYENVTCIGKVTEKVENTSKVWLVEDSKTESVASVFAALGLSSGYQHF